MLRIFPYRAQKNVSYSRNGVCKITVDETAVPPGPEYWDSIWSVDNSGEHNTGVIWTGDTPLPFKFKINSIWQTYKITGKRPIPKDEGDDADNHRLDFQCANQIGTFYVKDISIEEAKPEPKKNNHHWD